LLRTSRWQLMIERYTNCPRIRKRRLGGRLRPEGLATLTAPQGAAFEVGPPRHSRAAAQLTVPPARTI
jgi:hypothetical protein